MSVGKKIARVMKSNEHVSTGGASAIIVKTLSRGTGMRAAIVNVPSIASPLSRGSDTSDTFDIRDHRESAISVIGGAPLEAIAELPAASLTGGRWSILAGRFGKPPPSPPPLSAAGAVTAPDEGGT